MRLPSISISPLSARSVPPSKFKKRRLAGTGRSHDRNKIALFDIHRQLVEDFDLFLTAGIALFNIGEADQVSHWVLLKGAVTAFGDYGDGSRKRTPIAISGRMRGSRLSKPMRTRTVARLRSADGIVAMTWAGSFKAG